MKQNLTIEQLNELSEKGREKLRKWWKPDNGDVWKTDGGDFIFFDEKAPECELQVMGIELSFTEGCLNASLPLLSIGQMVEFLEENSEHEFSIFRRIVDWKIIYEGQHYGKILGGELCDALWEGVKEVLER